MVCSIDPALENHIHDCKIIDVPELVDKLEYAWRDSVWGEWRALSANTSLLRAIPTEQSLGFKHATYRHYFCADMLDKGEGFTPHVHMPAQIKALATFRMSSHDLNIERLRHRRVPRHLRICTCCTAEMREDELHVLECSAYADIRARFAHLFPEANGQPTETNMRRFMNPEHPALWRDLAEFLICVMAKRRELLEAQNIQD